MGFPLDLSILPKSQLEATFKTPLLSGLVTDMQKLKSEKQTFDDILAYTLHPFEFPSINNRGSKDSTGRETTSVMDAPLYWQTLRLIDQTLCSEVVIVQWQNSIYLARLNILPATFGLLLPDTPRLLFKLVNTFVTATINNLISAALSMGMRGIVSNIYNPNLVSLFTQQGFTRDKSREEIVGLPLPAIYSLDLLKHSLDGTHPFFTFNG